MTGVNKKYKYILKMKMLNVLVTEKSGQEAADVRQPLQKITENKV